MTTIPQRDTVREHDTDHEGAGRFEGDLDAVLTVLRGEKKPYRVKVWEWRWFATERGDELQWAPPHILDNRFDYRKDFRTLEKAVAYLYKVRAAAELQRLRGLQREQDAERREILS